MLARPQSRPPSSTALQHLLLTVRCMARTRSTRTELAWPCTIDLRPLRAHAQRPTDEARRRAASCSCRWAPHALRVPARVSGCLTSRLHVAVCAQFETQMAYKIVDTDPQVSACLRSCGALVGFRSASVAAHTHAQCPLACAQDTESATWATVTVTMRRVFIYYNNTATALDEGVAVIETQLSPYYRGERACWLSWCQRRSLTGTGPCAWGRQVHCWSSRGRGHARARIAPPQPLHAAGMGRWVAVAHGARVARLGRPRHTRRHGKRAWEHRWWGRDCAYARRGGSDAAAAQGEGRQRQQRPVLRVQRGRRPRWSRPVACGSPRALPRPGLDVCGRCPAASTRTTVDSSRRRWCRGSRWTGASKPVGVGRRRRLGASARPSRPGRRRGRYQRARSRHHLRPSTRARPFSSRRSSRAATFERSCCGRRCRGGHSRR